MTRDANETRLRSEQGATESRSRRVMANRAAAERRRFTMAEQLRAGLVKDLAIDGTTAQTWLVESAVSAMLEITELSARFLRCCATEAEMARLGRARSELTRTLRLLGLPKAQDDGNGSGQSLAAYLASRQSAQSAGNGTSSEAVEVES